MNAHEDNQNSSEVIPIIFHGIEYAFCIKGEFDEEKYFKEYHFWESYNPHKQYQTNDFIHDYGKGPHRYVLILHKISLKDYEQLKYVVAKEYLEQNELNELSKYCQCSVCTASFFSLAKYFTHPCRFECIKSPFPTQYSINRARSAMLG